MSSNFDDDLQLLNESGNEGGEIIGNLEVGPRDQDRIELGVYTADDPPKGFYTEVSPKPSSSNSVVTRITSLGTDKQYKLILHVANFSDETVLVKIGKL